MQALKMENSVTHIPVSPVAETTIPVLKVDGLTVRFAKKGVVFDNLDLVINEGDQVSILGSNGAGKSTLIKVCLVLVDVERGHVELFGKSLNSNAKTRKALLSQIGMVHQKHNLLSNGAALTNVVHGALGRVPFRPSCWRQGIAPARIRSEAMHYLDRVGLAHIADHKVANLSGGQSQRVAIARALMQKPKLIIADEPVASLDPKSGMAVMELFSNLVAEEGCTLIFISHHLSHALRFSNRIIGLQDKRVNLDVASASTSISELENIYGGGHGK